VDKILAVSLACINFTGIFSQDCMLFGPARMLSRTMKFCVGLKSLG
jgi:hypothetical protein